jgi:DNA-binding NarL/FixJ family response regulator
VQSAQTSETQSSGWRLSRDADSLWARNFVYRATKVHTPPWCGLADPWIPERIRIEGGWHGWCECKLLPRVNELQRPASPTSASLGLRQTPTFAVQPRSIHLVLVLDDERGVRDSLRLILGPQFRVLTASRGEAALRILEREPVSVMTLDLRMPGWSGAETLLRIREINSDLEVVFVMAYASYTEAMRAIRLRLDVVSNPSETHRVMETVRRAALRRETRLGPCEVPGGLTKRLIESIQLLSASEHLRLSQSQKLETGRPPNTGEEYLEASKRSLSEGPFSPVS